MGYNAIREIISAILVDSYRFVDESLLNELVQIVKNGADQDKIYALLLTFDKVNLELAETVAEEIVNETTAL